MAAKRKIQSRLWLLGCLGLAAALTPEVASASTFNYINGGIYAEAIFDINVDGNLQVTLTNKGTAESLVPTDVLTAVYWSGTPNLAIHDGLDAGSALLAVGSSVLFDPDGQPSGGIVGGEWAYNTGLGGLLGDYAAGADAANQGISSTGVCCFGEDDDRFPGANLAGPDSPDGVQYGLISAIDGASTPNGGVTGSGGLIKNSVIFTLLNTSSLGINLATIANVYFQYGTALNEPQYPGSFVPGNNTVVPIPAALPLLLGGMGGLAWLARRQKRWSSAA